MRVTTKVRGRTTTTTKTKTSKLIKSLTLRIVVHFFSFVQHKKPTHVSLSSDIQHPKFLTVLKDAGHGKSEQMDKTNACEKFRMKYTTLKYLIVHH